MNKIIVVVGPTAVGKTKLSIELAKIYDGEIINADSMQLYKELNIGTAKVTEEEKEGIPHHLFDMKDITEDYNIYEYQKDCRKCIEEILSRNKTPILVGGTGLYIKAALYDYKLESTDTNNQYEDLSNEDIYNKLVNIFPSINIDKNNRRRLVRALNYYENTGKLITENITDKLLYDAIFIGLTTDREELYNRINKRVDIMINNGLLDEVKHFHNLNIRTKPLLGGIGYKEIYNYLDGNISLDKAIEDIKKDSRHYAKRQYTFFNNQMDINWFNVDFNNFNNTINEVKKYIDKSK